LFHLCLIITLNTGSSYVLEKNEVINIAPAPAPLPETETRSVSMRGALSNTLNKILAQGQKRMGANWFVYNAFYNNCQDFILNVLLANNQASPAITTFVKQPLESIVKDLPSWTEKIANLATDAGAYANIAMHGQGGGHTPSSRFKKQLERAGVSPSAYLAKAQKKANAEGLAGNMLGYSTDDKHKLQIPNAQGKMIRFGSVGLGDFLLYSLAHDPTASEHRRRYLARATKIKGEWAKDPYSPNSLAIQILW
jgi:hypothetical protein